MKLSIDSAPKDREVILTNEAGTACLAKWNEPLKQWVIGDCLVAIGYTHWIPTNIEDAMSLEQIATMDYITLRATTEGVLANLTTLLGHKHPIVNDLKNLFARYDLELTTEPTQHTARLIAQRRLAANGAGEMPR